MRSETLTYQRLNDFGKGFQKGKEKIVFKNFLSTGNAIILPIAFLLGRASLVNGMMPFGMAMFAAAAGLSFNRLLLAFAVLLGIFTGGGIEQMFITLSAMLLFNVIMMPLGSHKTKLGFIYGIISFVSVLVPQIVLVYLKGFLFYDLLVAVFHAFVVFVLTFIFRNATYLLNELKKRQVFTNEEMISICIVAALALSGFGELQLLGFGIKNMLSIFLILLFSYKCGAGVGSAVGLSVGLIISMSSDSTPLVIGCYGFCGLLAGVFKNLGKTGASLGFILGNIVLTLYLNGSTDTFIYLKEIITAVVVFMIIPQKHIDILAGKFSRDIDTCMDKRSYSMRIKEMTIEKLNKFSKAFSELSKTFNEISETKVVTDKQDISALFDRVADRVCKDCSLCMHCWDRNFYNTYQVMFRIVERLEEKGRVESHDIPDYFMDRCERIEDFVDAVNNIYEIFKVDMVWKGKIGESRGLVSQQLDGLSRVISNLAKEIDLNVNFKSDLEDIIIMELNKAGIKANEAMVFENKWGKYEISIFHKGCGGKRICSTSIEKLVSGITGRKLTRENSECSSNLNGGNSCVLKLLEEESYKVTTGVAKISKYDTNVSGDSYTFMNAGDGKFIVALSDGMGSGERAATQSRAAINMLEQFMESGFDKDTAIKLINSILVLKSSDDSFATIDLSVIDLYDGEVEFVKIGAVPTYIKKSERVDIIKSVSLPAGILSQIETEMIRKKVDSGDFLIMMSDGIIDAFKCSDEDFDIKNYIDGIKSNNPQEIADSILNHAKSFCGGKPVDDMMVVTAKVWKRAA